MSSFIETPINAFFSIINIISALITLGLFVLKGFAIYTISKKQGLNKLWMSFVPFLNFILLGKVIGKCKVWGLNIKNIGLWLCIMMAIERVFSGLLNAGYHLDNIIKTLEGFGLSAKITFSAKFFEVWYLLTGGSLYASAIPTADLQLIATYTGLIIPIVDIVIWLAYAFFEIHFLLLIFKKYAPQNMALFTILCIFIPEALGVILFILRNNEPIDYDVYLQNRARARYTYYNGGYYNQNPYSNPYSNPYANPYNNPYQNPNATQGASTPADPFPEFGGSENSTKSGTDNPFGTEGFGQDN